MSEEKFEIKIPIVAVKPAKIPGWFFLFIAVIYPIFVIVFELYTQMCAESFFDPMPTTFHKVLVFLVPLSNLLIWLKMRSDDSLNISRLLILSAVSIGISAYYTLIFLPIMAIGFIAILFYGIGLLPFAPVISLITASKLYLRLKTKHDRELGDRKFLFKGIIIALFSLLLLDVPSTATYFGVNWAASDSAETRERGIKLLRALGDEELLLRLSYEGSRKATGLLSFAAMMLSDREHVSTTKAREIFYRVTGEAFNINPLPYTGRGWSRYNDFMFDPDQGGSEVGGRIKGLDLVSSRLDGIVKQDEGLVYLEWVFEFKNNSHRQREARLQIALPPKSVVSRATLWINGEEREAAFAGKAKVRQAYEKVVKARRDPLLVTTAGTDRVLAQAFPIEPRGGSIKFRIGITAPLKLTIDNQASLVLPAIVDRNFNIDNNVKHAVWFEGKQPFTINLAELEEQQISSNLHRLSGSIADKSLSTTRKLLITKLEDSNSQLISIYQDYQPIIQQVVTTKRETKDVLLLVVDGSVKVASSIKGIVASLKNIPLGKKVGLIIAGDESISVPIENWTKQHQHKIETALNDFEFIGGRDNAPAIASGLLVLEKYDNSELLWIHSPQPIKFENSSAVLEQATKRLVRLPHVSSYSLSSGPNKLLDDSKWLLDSSSLAHLGSIEDDLGEYIKDLFNSDLYLKFNRYATNADVVKDSEGPLQEVIKPEVKEASQHIARLWARDKIYSLLLQGKKDEALILAAQFQLVTAVSGAVVLENQQEFAENDLSSVDKNTVPTIPEPHQWILAFILVVFILWFLRQNKFVLARQV